jgi:hypothetical protein
MIVIHRDKGNKRACDESLVAAKVVTLDKTVREIPSEAETWRGSGQDC